MLAIPLQAFSADLLKANTDFKNKDYAQATTAYLEGAELGSAHAYYQLGVIHSMGLGTPKDPVNALIYFYLAAQQNYHNASSLLYKMLSNLDTEQQQSIKALLKNYESQQAEIQEKYFPVINQNNLAFKVTFNGKAALEHKVYSEDLQTDSTFDEFDISSGGFDDEEDDSTTSIISSKKPILIVEHDVGSDGSIRNILDIQKRGATIKYREAYKLFPLAKPEFKGMPVEFIHRAYIGAAVYDGFDIREEYPALHRELRMLLKKGTDDNTLVEQYNYAMALLNFPWLATEPDQAEFALKKLSKKGHPSAMYEYGLKLYREQKNIPQAIHWISEASKFGLARAEYRLAKILQTSPWVMADDSKALFWYESAMEKGHAASTLRATEIKLTSKDLSLRDVNGAIEYLAQVKDSQTANPEYFHLLALSYKDRKQRDFKLVVENLETAIRIANRANWDVSEWEDLLATLTTGRVSITE